MAGRIHADDPVTKHHLPLHDRLMLYVRKEGDCWLWEGTRTKFGYGTITIRRDGRPKPGYRVHKLAYELAFGPVPAGAHVLHRCDVRNCVNPAHLWLGTNADNVRDKVAKNRQARGERFSHAKLTEAQAREIRMSAASTRALAAQYGVSKTVTHQIKAGVLWRHTL